MDISVRGLGDLDGMMAIYAPEAEELLPDQPAGGDPAALMIGSK